MYACPSNRRAQNFHRQSSPSSRAPSGAVVVIDRSIVRSFDPKSPRRAPSLSRVFRAHRFVRAPERGSTRVNTASRDDARGLTSDDGGCGEHGASLEKCASSSEARARQTTTPVPLRPPSTRPKTRVDGRATVDGGRWTSRFSRARRSASKGVHSHSFIHSFIHSSLDASDDADGRRPSSSHVAKRRREIHRARRPVRRLRRDRFGRARSTRGGTVGGARRVDGGGGHARAGDDAATTTRQGEV